MPNHCDILQRWAHEFLLRGARTLEKSRTLIGREKVENDRASVRSFDRALSVAGFHLKYLKQYSAAVYNKGVGASCRNIKSGLFRIRSRSIAADLKK